VIFKDFDVFWLRVSFVLYVQGPRTWNLQGLQQWMQAIVPSKDFLSLLYSLIFLTSIHPVKCEYLFFPHIPFNLHHCLMYVWIIFQVWGFVLYQVSVHPYYIHELLLTLSQLF